MKKHLLKNNKGYKKSIEDIILDVIIYIILTIILIATFYPVYYVLVASFSNSTAITTSPGRLLWPVGFNFSAYTLTFSHPWFFSGYMNTLKILAIALPLNVITTLIAGYFMASRNVMFKKSIVYMMMFTMYFSGGLIPTYLNMDQLGLTNTLWSLILPGMVSVFNTIICRTAIEAIPESLLEAAQIDGAGELTVLFRIVAPLIGSTLAVICLYYTVGHWNSWFPASLYITDNSLMPLQNIMRSILLANESSATTSSLDNFNEYAEAIKYASIVISTIPILLLYPFIQRFFVKGVMIGAAKE